VEELSAALQAAAAASRATSASVTSSNPFGALALDDDVPDMPPVAAPALAGVAAPVTAVGSSAVQSSTVTLATEAAAQADSNISTESAGSAAASATAPVGVHSNTSAQAFKCPKCEFSADAEDTLQEHMLTTCPRAQQTMEEMGLLKW
jgi:hypothetical protein